MPIVPNLLERLMLLRMNLAPGVMLDFLGAQAFRAACAAQRLGVFEALGAGPLTSAEVATRVKADARGTTLLLEALAPLGYVTQRGGRYANSAMTAKWLPVLGDGMRYFETMLWEEWAQLEDSIRRGRPPLTGYDRLAHNPERWAEFEAGMLAVARMTADEVVARVKLPPTARRLLDVGGGHGYYSVAFCRRHPRIAATVVDLADAVPAAERTIVAEHMADRVAIRTGDFWRDDLGDGWDVALLFNLLHGYPPDRLAQLLRRMHAALGPGGRVVILDQVRGKAASPIGEAVARLQGLNMFNASEGRAYANEEIARWLTEAGFGDVRPIRLRRSPGFGLVVATKPLPS
jgi:SAM-dependent methyltransferase